MPSRTGTGKHSQILCWALPRIILIGVLQCFRHTGQSCMALIPISGAHPISAGSMEDIFTTGLVGAPGRRALLAAVPVGAVGGAAAVDVGVDVVAADVVVDSEIMCSTIIVGLHPNIYFLLRLCTDHRVNMATASTVLRANTFST